MTVDTGECPESRSRTPCGVRPLQFSERWHHAAPSLYLLFVGFFAALALEALAGLLAVFLASAALPAPSFFR